MGLFCCGDCAEPWDADESNRCDGCGKCSTCCRCLDGGDDTYLWNDHAGGGGLDQSCGEETPCEWAEATRAESDPPPQRGELD